jgi:ADP-ribose pyrophosphatase YjhB (NUDIX family)
MGNGRQTVKAMAAIRRPRDGALLVSRYTGPDSGPFHRLLGGHVEFGEYAADTVRREFLEEIGQRLSDVGLLGVVENIFQWKGQPLHEVVFIFSARFTDPAAYEITEQPILDDPGGQTRVIWRPSAAVSPPLYPDGVAGLVYRAQLDSRA